MAPLPTIDHSLTSGLDISSLELDRRTSPEGDIPSYISSLTISKRQASGASSYFTKSSSGSLSPLSAGSLLRARDATPQSRYTPGSATIPPTSINNKGVLALFALLSASLVIASIWFFFWAKNGGFHFRKGDWEDYKSTVLRRKGPDGKTLSNATKSTELGGGSIVASTERTDDFASIIEEKPRRNKRGKKQSKNSHDNDVRAYRHEKPAKVGGLNREPDGSYHDYSNTDPSELSEIAHPLAHKHNKPSKKEQKPASTPKNKQPRNFSYAPGTESTFSVYSDDSHRPLRASPAHHRHSRESTPSHTPVTRSRQPSPIKNQQTPTHKPRHSATRGSARESSYTDPIDFESRYTASEAETEQSRGTKAYFHPIPGLSAGAGNGFRRGGGRRRDSLSDSEGETGTVRS
ncbi:MAG: hypothetical protein Q9187_002852 [Circinaria calcarea]